MVRAAGRKLKREAQAQRKAAQELKTQIKTQVKVKKLAKNQKRIQVTSRTQGGGIEDIEVQMKMVKLGKGNNDNQAIESTDQREIVVDAMNLDQRS